jgi:signal transduction histidine kinase/CheY-like chemotaxis protein
MKHSQNLILLVLITFGFRVDAQKLWTEPVDFRVDSTVTVYFDLNKCVRGKSLIGRDSLYFWSVHPKYAGDSLQGPWEKAALPSLMKHEGNNVWSFTLIPTEFYGLDSATMASNEWWAQVKPKDGGNSSLGMKSSTVTEYMGIIRQPVVNLQIPGQFRSPRQMQYRFMRLDVSNQVLPDPDASLSIQAVLDTFDRGGFQFFDQMESDVYMLKPFWQYTHVRNPDTLAHTFMLSVGIFGAGWNDAMAYTRDAGGRLDTFSTGYLRPLSEKAIPDWRNFFKIELGPGESKQVFVRVADYDSHEVMPPTEFLWQIDESLLRTTENKYVVNAAVMISILSFAVLFYLFWFFMSGKKEHAFHSLLWSGFLLSVLIPSPMGSYFVINEIAPVVTNWFDLAVGWLLVSSITLWGLLGFSVNYLEFKTYAPKAIRPAWILAFVPVLLFIMGGVNYAAPEIFPYNPYSWDGFFYFPSTNIRSVLMAVAFLFVAILAIRIAWKGFKPARFYLIAFVPLTVAACLVSMSNLRMAFKGYAIGLPHELNMLNYASMILALVLFGLAIGYKQKKLEKEHIEAQAKLLEAQKKSLEEEARANEQRLQLRERELSLQEERNKQIQLKELNELKNRFYTNITHEFRTPLTVIMGMADNIKGNEQEKKLILRNSRNLLRLINQLLDLSKLEKGSLPMKMVQSDVVAFTQYLTESFFSMAEEKHIRLTFYAEEENILMDFDEEKLQYIVYNLLSNALKFTPGRGKVILHLKEEGDYLKIKVQDTGAGIPAEQLPRIFDRFYQVEKEGPNEKPEGTGIGLAYAKELVNLLGGKIEVQSEVGKGTTFDCYLPITRKAPLHRVETTAVGRTRSDREPTQGATGPLWDSEDRPLVLITEDNPDLVTYMQSILSPHYEIQVARNGQEGIDQALEVIPDLIISDIMMPVKDGLELCETLKANVRTSHIPIILLTAKATQDDKVKGLTYGADAYLLKPFDKKELLVRVEKLIQLRRSLQALYASGLVHSTTADNGQPDRENEFLVRLRERIVPEIGNADFTIPELAAAMAMSQIQVYRKLKALTGQTPSQFIRQIRLEKGKELLLDEERTVAEVAYDVGFTDPNYFSKTFHQAFGVPPGEYRKRK